MADLTNPHVQLRVGVDTSDATAGFQNVTTAADQMAKGVKKAGKEASDALGGMREQLDKPMKGPTVPNDHPLFAPPESDKSLSNRIARQTGAVKSELQRLIAAAESAGQQSKRVEALIDFRGLNKNDPEIQAYLSRLKQAEAGMGNLGMTAKATSAALRQVPAQFTDIVVSLAGGQNPMTVLLQQGGQLKDVFGGVGAAARALGGYVLGLVNPISATVAVAAGLGAAFYAGSRESAEFSKTLTLSGNQAGVTAGQLMLMAQSIDSIAGTQGNAAEVLNGMASSGKIAASVMQEVATAAIQMERAGGPAASDLVKEFTKLGDKPLESALELNKTYGFLTLSTYEQIKALEEQGRTTEAATVAQKAFADSLNQKTPEMERNLGSLERGWRSIKDVITEAWDALKNIGREVSPEGQRAALGGAIKNLEEQIKLRGSTSGGTYFDAQTEAMKGQLATLKERQSLLQSDERLLKSAAAAQADQARQVEARAKWDKDGVGYLDKKKKMELEIAQAIRLGNDAKMEQADIDKRVADIREKYKEKEKKGKKDDFAPGQDAAKEWAKYMQAFGSAALDAQGKTDGLTKSQEKLIEYLGSSAYLEMDEPARQLALQAAYAAIANEQLNESFKKQDELYKQTAKSAESYAKQLDAIQMAGADLLEQANERNRAVDEQVAATQFEATLIGKSNTERAIALKQYKIQADLLKEIARINASIAEKDDKTQAIATVTAAAEKAKANAAAEVVNAEFERVSNQIEQSLTDALMRGFENGKGFAENLRDTIANMFKTLVLRPVISAVMNPIAGAITGSLGLAGTANAATGAASSLGGVGNALGALGTGLGSGFGMIAGGGIGGWLSASTSLIGTGTAAGAMAGIGALAGPIGAVLAVASLIKSLDDSGTAHTGGSAMADMVDGIKEVESASIGFNLAMQDVSKSTVKASKALAVSALDILKGLDSLTGGNNKFSVATGFADDSSRDGSWGNLVIAKNGQSVVDWRDTQTSRWAPKEFADGEAGAKEYGAAVAAGIKQAIDTLDLPDWAGNIVARLGDSPSMEELTAAMQQIQAMPAQMLQAIGTSAEALGGMIYEGMQASDPEGAGKAIADQITYGIEASIYNGFGNTITSIISTQLVTPVVSAMQAGATLTEAMSKASIETMKQQVAAAGAAFAAIVNDPGFKTALAEINTLISETVGGALGGAKAPIAPVAYEPLKPADKIKDTAASTGKTVLEGLMDEEKRLRIQEAQVFGDTAEEIRLLTQGMTEFEREVFLSNRSLAENIAAQQRVNSLKAEEKNLRVELLQAEGKTAEALAMLTEGMGEAEKAQYLLNESLRDQIKLIDTQKEAAKAAQQAAEEARDAFLSLVDAAYNSADRFLSAAEARMFKLEVLANKLVQGGGGAGVEAYRDAMAGMNAEQIKQFVQQFLFSGASVEQKGIVLEVGNQLLDMLDKSAEATKQAAKLIEDAAKEIQSAGKGIADFITKTRATLLGTRSEVETLQALRANYLTDLSGSRGNNLDALGRVTGSAESYLQAAINQSSTAAQARATVAQVLAELGGLPAVQSYEQQSLVLLGEIKAKTAENTVVVGRVVDATGEVVTATTDTSTNTAGVKANTANIKGNFWDVDQAGFGIAVQWHVDMLSHTVQSTNFLDQILARLNAGIQVFGAGTTAPTVAPAAKPSAPVYDASLSQAAKDHLAAGGSPQAIYDAIKSSGMTLAQAEIVLGATPGSLTEEAKKLGLPAFASGGMHSGGLRLVGENGPELEVTGPSRILSNAQLQGLMGGGQRRDEALVAELRSLREDNRAQASALANLQQRIIKLHERWDRDGLPETRAVA